MTTFIRGAKTKPRQSSVEFPKVERQHKTPVADKSRMNQFILTDMLKQSEDCFIVLFPVPALSFSFARQILKWYEFLWFHSVTVCTSA